MRLWKPKHLLEISIESQAPEHSRKVLKVVPSESGWLATAGAREELINGSDEADLLSNLAATFPDHFRVFHGDRFQIRTNLSDPNLVYLHLHLDGDEGAPLNGLHKDWEFLSNDYALPTDRQVLINKRPAALTRDGLVIPFNSFEGSRNSIFSIGWSETESRTSGLDQYAFVPLSAQVALIDIVMADDDRQFQLVPVKNVLDAVYQLVMDLNENWSGWAYHEHPNALLECLIDLLSSGLGHATYWGLNIHEREPESENQVADGHDCNEVGCWRASPTSYWSFEHELDQMQSFELLQRIQILLY